MKKNIFLISIFFIFFAPSLLTNFDTSHKVSSYQFAGASSEINIAPANYLNLSNKNGAFYSWDQSDNSNQHIIGIFTNNNQSYLLDNFGVFWSLDYQISKFYRVNNQYGIARIKYYQDENQKEYIDENFVIELANNKFNFVNTKPLATHNNNFVVLSDTSVLSYGIGLDFIDITNQSVSNLIKPYENGKFSTVFTKINDNSGIFVGDDQYFYLLKNITSTAIGSKEKINLQAPIISNSDAVVVNSNNVVLRSKNNGLYFLDINNISNLGDWKKTSHAKNIAFGLNQDTFILNVDYPNISTQYGSPFLVKAANWETLIKIANIKTISNFSFTDNTNGIFIDKDLTASNFKYNSSDDSFTISSLGILNNFQIVNKNLVFGSINENNLLISSEANKIWSAIKSIQLSKSRIQYSENLLNNVIVTKDGTEINYQNTYFADGSANLSVIDEKLVSVEIKIKSTGAKRILTPLKNQVNYEFSNFDNYQVTINFFSDNSAYAINYQVNIVSFLNKELLHVSGTNLLSYVGASKGSLYDIKSIDKKNNFTINQYNYNYLQYAQLLTYSNSKNIVVENLHTLISGTEIEFNNNLEKDNFYGIKTVNLLNQVSWVYLGFSIDNNKPMIDFWDTTRGKSLMNQALTHRWLERDLRKLNAQEIKDLLATSKTWTSIEVQGKAIVITIITIFAISLAAIIISISYNMYLNKRIITFKVEQNKILKNSLN